MKRLYNSLFEFETERKLEEYIPPTESNTFYNINNGVINIYCNDNERFDLYTNKGIITSGENPFIIGENSIYDSLTVIENTELIINDELIIDGSTCDIHGVFRLLPNTKLVVKNNANVVFYTDSTFYIGEGTIIEVDNSSTLKLYGDIHCHLYRVEDIYNNKSITIDSAAVMIVDGLDSLGNRTKSLIDYDIELRNKDLKKYSQGEINTEYGRIGYTCLDKNDKIEYQLLNINILWGEAILGDFKYQVLGTPNSEIEDLQVINKLKIDKNATLYISDEYHGYKYMHPQLYIGVILNNTYSSNGATLEIDGKVIVDGKRSSINVDRGCSIRINKNGELWLKNNSTIESTHNEDTPVLFIDGTLYIERIEQIDTFDDNNIVIGDTGKVVILNNNYTDRKVLFSTPIGIQESTLYRLFKDRLDHIEYHIQNNTGIRIDKYYSYYYVEFDDWYGGKRLEKAIADGMIVWHDGGFIDIVNDITPWANSNCTLLDITKLFRATGDTIKDRLQNIISKFKYVGCGNITFRFIDKRTYTDIVMKLDDIKMTSIIRYPQNDLYKLTTNNDGKLFIRNNVTQITVDNIINNNSRILDITDKQVTFNIDD